MLRNKVIVRSIVIIVILILSVIFGLVFQGIWNVIDKKTYPLEYEELVEKYADKYGVPEYVVYSVIKVESDFESGAVSSAGAVGLMQMMPETFNWLTGNLKENLDSAMLYDPETNIKYGTYYLSYLYIRYGDWDEVFAAYNAGHGKVDEWLENEDNVDENGRLDNIPYKETANYLKKINKAIDVYKRLYFEK